jgi:hypothetical protein
MALDESPERKPAAFPGTIFLQSLNSVLRTGGLKPARGCKMRGYGFLVETHKYDE